jgi:hypothetical protein
LLKLIKNKRVLNIFLLFVIGSLIVINSSNSNYARSEISANSIGVEEDLDPPVITPSDDLIYYKGSSGNYISWILEDDNPGFYELYRDEIQFTSSPAWGNGQNLSFNVDQLSVGIHNYTIVAIDVFENRATSTIWVTVVNPEETSYGWIFTFSIPVLALIMYRKRRISH